MIAAYLIELRTGKPAYELEDLAAEYGVERCRNGEVEEETSGAHPARLRCPRRLAGQVRARLQERGGEELYDRIELPLTASAPHVDGGRRHQIDAYRMWRDRRPGGRPGRGARDARVRARRRGVQPRLAPQLAQASSSATRAPACAKGKTGYSTDARVLRSIRAISHPIIPRSNEWHELSKLLKHVSRFVADTSSPGRTPPHHLQPAHCRHSTGYRASIEPAGHLDSYFGRSRRIPSAFVAATCRGLVSADATRRSSCACSQRSAPSRSCSRRSPRGEDIHGDCPLKCSAKDQSTADEGASATSRRWSTAGSSTASRRSASPRTSKIPARRRRRYIDTYLARFPMVQDFIQRTIEQAKEDGYVTTLFGQRRPVRRSARPEPPDPLARRTTRRQLGVQGPRPTSSRSQWCRSTIAAGRVVRSRLVLQIATNCSSRRRTRRSRP